MIPELNGDFLQWLRGFYYVAKTGSVRAAAELMHRNPSTISYQLRSLEEELNTVLFDRFKKRLRITPEGRKLLGWTISTFETLQSMRSAVGTTDGRLRGEVRFASTLPVIRLVVEAVAAFRTENPLVDIYIQRNLNQEIVQLVRESSLDFGLTGLTRLPETDSMELCLKARPLLVINRDNHWDVPAIPPAGDLERLPYVVFESRDNESGSPTLQAEVRRFQKNACITANNHHIILQFVRHGVGCAIMDELCYRGTMYGADWSSITAIPLDHLLPNVLYGTLVRRGKHLSPQAKALMETLRSRLVEMAAHGFDCSVPRPAQKAPKKGEQPRAARPRKKRQETDNP